MTRKWDTVCAVAKRGDSRTVVWTSARLFLVSFATGLLIVALFTIVGSSDIEETANSSYSVAADTPSRETAAGNKGTISIFGVPAFDTMQGTGDRLPYQASWAQSVTWILRLLISWEHISLVRSFVFLVFATTLMLATLITWVPNLSKSHAVLFAVLANSSFGLFIRQNDWSDHYVQVVGIAATTFFMMRRNFHDSLPGVEACSPRVTLLCLFASINGVITGHPGLWPAAFFVWLSFILVFVSQKDYRFKVINWFRFEMKLVTMGLMCLVGTALVVSQDLVSELSGNSWTSGRLSRTQGLFSQFAFGGVYGLTDGGSIPDGIRQAIAALLGTTVMPLFVLIDGILPSQIRASDFRELPRVEFSGALVLLVFALAWRSLTSNSIRRFVLKVIVAQALVWVSVAISVADVVPTMLASSGAWMTLATVLPINLFLTYLLISEMHRKRSALFVFSVVNVVLIGYWCLIQFGFASLSAPVRFPEQFPSRLAASTEVLGSPWYLNTSTVPDRALISSTPNFYDFLGFVAAGYPVVAPADPKMRASGQLQSNFAFNFSINPPRFEGMTPQEIDRTLDFLQVRYLLVGESTRPDASQPPQLSKGLLSVLDDLGSPEKLDLRHVSFSVFERERFSVFITADESTIGIQQCPVLFEACSVAIETLRVSTSSDPHLRRCEHACLWTFSVSMLRDNERVIIPVTYDEALEVRDSAGAKLDTSSVGGFLGVGSKSGVNEGLLTVNLDPDVRMLSRVAMSYANVAVFILLLGNVMCPWVKSRRRKLRVE